MTRVKRGVATKKRHKRMLKMAKGYRGKRGNVFTLAKNAVMKAGQNSYKGRKLKKRQYRSLWIVRINAALKDFDMKYSRFIDALLKANIIIDRKILADLAMNNKEAFKAIVEQVK
jgi:large subunit ribosomal protein L20